MGLIYQLNRKPQIAGERGLPKKPVDKVHVTAYGMEGDFNNYRHDRKAGTLDRALLVLPKETLEQLAREGWPVQPGDLGENITTQGVLYDALQLESRYQAGEVLLQITEICNPCKNLALLPYIGEERVTEFMKAILGRRGWYARVLQEGVVQKGDAFQQLSGR